MSRITAVDTHTDGQATRVVVAGIGELPGGTMSARQEAFRLRADHLRTMLLHEPRGHRGMFGCVLTEPGDPKADFGALFLHNAGYMPMSGHGVMGVATALVESGIVETIEPTTNVVIDTVAGVVEARVAIDSGRAAGVTVRGVPSWIGALATPLELPGYGEVLVDVASSGNQFVWAWAEHLGIDLAASNIGETIDAAMTLLEVANEKISVRDPITTDPIEINVATILDAPHHELPAVRNVHVFGARQVDRSPGGTGASARLAVMQARGEIGVDEEVTVESVVTNRAFKARIVAPTAVGSRSAVITEVSGRAHVTGHQEFVVDTWDPLLAGFLIGGLEA